MGSQAGLHSAGRFRAVDEPCLRASLIADPRNSSPANPHALIDWLSGFSAGASRVTDLQIGDSLARLRIKEGMVLLNDNANP